MNVGLALILMVLLLLLKGFFSGSEIALVNSDKIKLRHRAKHGHKGSQLAFRLLKSPDVLLSSTLVGTNIATVALATVGTMLMFELVGEDGDLWAFLIYTPFFLILGEIVPKSVYQQKSDTLTPIIVQPLLWTSRLFYPVVFVFSRIARLAVRLVGAGKVDQSISVTREQVNVMIEMAEHTSAMRAFDKGSVRRVMRFAETTVAEAMIPLVEVTTIPVDESTSEAVGLVRKRGYNRLPVFEGHSSNITGIVTLTTWDLLDPSLLDKPLTTFLNDPLYVTQLQTIDKLLPILRQRPDHMAIVVDEFGAASGMITMEDIVEEVVGEIDVGYDFDEYLPRRRHTVDALEEEHWLVDARLPIAELNELLGLRIPSQEFHTVGGMVMVRLRRIPQTGDAIDEAGFLFTVTEATARTIEKVSIERVA